MTITVLDLVDGKVASSALNLRITLNFVGSYKLRVDLCSSTGVELYNLLNEEDMRRWSAAFPSTVDVPLAIPAQYADGDYKVKVVLSGYWSPTYGSVAVADAGEVAFTLDRIKPSNWTLYASRPAPAVNSQDPGVICEVAGVLYYLHEEQLAEADSATDKYRLFKLDGGLWVELTGPSMFDAVLFAPVNNGDEFTSEWWQKVTAYDLGDGRIAFAGWRTKIHATYREQTPDPYQFPIPVPNPDAPEGKALVRVYDIALDSWTDYEDTEAVALDGNPFMQGTYLSGTTLFPVGGGDVRFNIYGATARASDGKLLMAVGGDPAHGPSRVSAARQWDPATGNFATLFVNQMPPYGVDLIKWYYHPQSIIGEWYGWGWFGYMGDVLHVSTSEVEAPELSYTKVVYRWHEPSPGVGGWQATTIEPEGIGPSWYGYGSAFPTHMNNRVLNWGFQHNGNGATPTPYGVEVATVDGATAPSNLYLNNTPILHRVFRYVDGEKQDLGLTGETETFQGANIWAGANNVYLVKYSGIYRMVLTGDTTAPTVEITSPSAGATIAGAVQVGIHATDNAALATIRAYITAGGVDVLIGTQAVSGLAADASFTLNTTLFADGVYTIKAVAIDASGNMATDTITVTINNASPPVDTTPPTVDITAPGNGQNVGGSFVVRAIASDDVGVVKLRLLVRGVPYGADVVVSGKLVEHSWTVDASGWANGLAAIVVVAWDAAGNQGSDAINVTVTNLLADQEAVLYGDELPVSGEGWRLGNVPLRAWKLDVLTGDVPADPRQTYNVYPFWTQAGATGIAADYTDWDPFATREVLSVAPSSKALRWALVARPTYRSSYWDVPTAVEAFRILTCGTRTIVVTRDPVALYELSGASLTQLLDLSATSFSAAVLSEAVWSDSKVMLATDQGLIVLDLDAGDEPLLLRLDNTTYATSALATKQGRTLLRQNGKLYALTFPSPDVIAQQMPNGYLWSDDTYTYAAGTDLKLYGYVTSSGDSYGGNWNELYTVGGAVLRIFRDPDDASAPDVWIGARNSVHRAQPTWSSDGTFTGDVLALAKWRGYVWAAGTIGGLWRRTEAGWSQYDQLGTLGQINDMAVVDDRLYIAAKYDSGGVQQARLLRLQVDFGGDFQCGPQPPDVLPRAIDYLEAEV